MFRTRDILAVIFLLVVGFFATIVYRANYTNPASTPNTTAMAPEEFKELCDTKEERAFFFIHDKHARKFENILKEDTIESIFIVKDNKAERYSTAYPLVNLEALSGMDNETIVEKVKRNELIGFDLIKDKDEYGFNIEPDGERVRIDISNPDGTNKSATFNQEVPDDEIVQDLILDENTYCGYLHQSKNVDRFLKYQVVALLTLQPNAGQ